MKNRTKFLFGLFCAIVGAGSVAKIASVNANQSQMPTAISVNTIQAVVWQLGAPAANQKVGFSISHLSSDGRLYRYYSSDGMLIVYNTDGTIQSQSKIASLPLKDFAIIDKKIIYIDSGIHQYDPEMQTNTIVPHSGNVTNCAKPDLSVPGRDISQIGKTNQIVVCTKSVENGQRYCNLSVFNIVDNSSQTILQASCGLNMYFPGDVVAGADGKIYAKYLGGSSIKPKLPRTVGIQYPVYSYDLQNQSWSLYPTQYPVTLNFGDTALIYVDENSSLYYLATIPDAPGNVGLPRFTVIIIVASGATSVFTSHDLNSADKLADITPDGRLILIKSLSTSLNKPFTQSSTYGSSMVLTPFPAK